ncbi:MAG: tRNA (adenosine(37)-N6)-dimethylallyltransferase MiaA [Tissierellia bacterium]|nr:tRNA (adenosine(37)-N6)-dimethylallyltransferase MiaA [Bacillota bacterium]NLL23551.1 tRNA (adenosine(37)-N6)-dimethylallyltransferase MiaA [Tissierellia bacterium]
MQESKIVVIFGATASGKTELSVSLAQSIHAQIINMDSMQIYKRLSIGTAKPTQRQRRSVAHHLFDFLEPDEEYSVALYQKDALRAIEKVFRDGDIPLLVGGTGLYLSSLYYDYSFREKSENEIVFSQLLQELGAEKIASQLIKEGVCGLDQVDIENPHRLFRVWQTRQVHPKSERTRSNLPMMLFHLVQPREILHERIERRTKRMLEEGLIEEVQGLLETGFTGREPAMKGIGYRECIRYLQGEMSLSQLETSIVVSTRRYAKRQLTWIRNQYPCVEELDGTMPIETLISHISDILKESL